MFPVRGRFRCRAIAHTVCTVSKPLRLWDVPTFHKNKHECVCVCVCVCVREREKDIDICIKLIRSDKDLNIYKIHISNNAVILNFFIHLKKILNNTHTQ